MEKRFEKQVAIVTGGADGIGKHIARRLASEGAAVAIFDASAKQSAATVAEFAAEGLVIEPHHLDVADEQPVSEAIAHVAERHGQLDILVHCAGIVGPNATKITEVEAKDFDRVVGVNLRGSFLVTKYALRQMQPRNYGRILLFASIAGKEGNAGMCAYSSTKAAVIGLVKSAGK